MGIIKAAVDAVTGTLSDSWLEIIEADDMGEQVVFTKGKKVRTGQNKKGTTDTVSNGSVIHVYPNQFMILVDGGKVVDYTAEEGYFKVDNSSLPSLFNGQFKETLMDSFERIKYGGQTPTKQEVFFINLQEIKGIKFGTSTPVNYFDNFYNAELFLRAHGTYSIKIVDPLKFYKEVIPRSASRVSIGDINDQYKSEFMDALQSAINQMSADGIRISYVTSKSRELSKYMASVLDEDWTGLRGMEVLSVGIASVSYDDKSKELIEMRNQGAMLSDPTIREGFVQGNIAQGIKDAGSNANGAAAGFMGVGMGLQSAGGFLNSASQTNAMQMQMQQQQQMANQQMQQAPQMQPQSQANAGAAPWTCSCGAVNTGKFCQECGKPKPSADWTCSCGAVNTGKFCQECGKPRP